MATKKKATPKKKTAKTAKRPLGKKNAKSVKKATSARTKAKSTTKKKPVRRVAKATSSTKKSKPRPKAAARPRRGAVTEKKSNAKASRAPSKKDVEGIQAPHVEAATVSVPIPPESPRTESSREIWQGATAAFRDQSRPDVQRLKQHTQTMRSAQRRPTVRGH